jgi:hypothetical protein
VKIILSSLLTIKRSIVACIVAAILGLLSMGALGGGLYYAAYPLLAPFFGNPNDWRGDWVWPTMILAGILWSLSFPVAGYLDHRLVLRRHAPGFRRVIYALVLWGGAAICWALLLAGPLRIS